GTSGLRNTTFGYTPTLVADDQCHPPVLGIILYLLNFINDQFTINKERPIRSLMKRVAQSAAVMALLLAHPARAGLVFYTDVGAFDAATARPIVGYIPP